MRRAVVFSLLFLLSVTVVTVAFAGAGTETRGALAPVTLRFYFPGPTPDDAEMVWANIEKLTKGTLNAKFDVKWFPWSEYGDKVKLMAASGDNYDMHFDGYWLDYPALLAQGSLLPLNDLFDKYAPKLKADLTKVGALVTPTVNGKIWGVPWTKPQINHAAAVIREDLRKKYNVPAKFDTIEDVENFIDTVRKGEPQMLAVSNVYGKGWASQVSAPPMYAMTTKYELSVNMAFEWYYTYNLNDLKNIKVVPLERTQAFRDAMKISRRWAEKGYIPKDAMSVPMDGRRFEDGNVIANIDNIDVGLGDYTFESSGFFLYKDKKADAVSSMGNAVVFNAKAANPERTMMFLEWLNASQANYDALMYGIEGKTYVLTDFQGRKMADVLPGTDPAKSYIMWNGRWGLWRYAYMRGGPADGGKRMMTQGLPAELALPGNVFSPLLSFNFDTTPVKTELAKRVAVWDDYGRQLEFGMIADADKGVDQMIKLCTDAGADIVLKELQKQVDAFMARK